MLLIIVNYYVTNYCKICLCCSVNYYIRRTYKNHKYYICDIINNKRSKSNDFILFNCLQYNTNGILCKFYLTKVI